MNQYLSINGTKNKTDVFTDGLINGIIRKVKIIMNITETSFV